MDSAGYNILQVILFTLAGLYQAVRQDFNVLEIAILAVLAVLILRRGFNGRLWFVSRWEAALGALARRPAIAFAVLGAAAIAIRLILIPVLPVPKPVVSDEFSHLLLADTLLHGRVANPTHPMWPHFESLQIIQQPHYVSNYFPGHAAVLAAARLLMGNPWLGVVLMSGVCCAVIAWMLAGWMPRRWALFGGVLALLRFSIGSYWVNSFYGGFLPAIGGAMVAGAYPRLRERTSIGMSIVFGGGLAILAFTRPYEGLLFSLPFAVALVRSWLRWRFMLPVAAMVAASVVGLGLYFKQVTGSPLRTTYSISQSTYGWPASIGWAKPVPIVHRNIELRRYYLYELDEHTKVDSVYHFITYLALRIQEYWRFFIGPMLTIPLLFLAAVWRGRRLRVLMIALAAAFAAVMFEGAAMPHYLAPATGAIMAVIVECIRRLRTWRFRGHRTGLLLARAAPVVIMVVLGVRIVAENVGLPYTQKLNYQSWCCKQQGNYAKARVAAFLAGQPGKHLVIVEPKRDEDNLLQWIYNDADIDGSQVVWARDLGPEENRKLVEYFRDRTVWWVDPNAASPRAVAMDSAERHVAGRSF